MLEHAKRDMTALLCAGGLSMILLSGCTASDTEATTASDTSPTPAQTQATPVANPNLSDPATSKNTTSVSSLNDLVNNATKPKTTDPAADAAARKLEAQRLMARARLASSGGFQVTAQPTVLELGDIPLNEAKTGTIKLTNTGSTPMKVSQCKSSCGCTAAKCPEGLTLQPGEVTEVEIRMSGGTSARQISKKVTFIIDGQDPMEVPVNGNAVAYIETVPERVAIDDMTGRPFVLRSIDGAPFRIQRMVPAIAKDFGTEPMVEHTLNIDWSQWDAVAGNRRRLTIYTDHPRNPRVSVFVQPSAASIAAKNQQSTQDQINTSRNVKQDLINQATAQAKAAAQATGDPGSMLAMGNYDAFLEALKSGEVDVNGKGRDNAPLINLAAEKDAMAVVEAMLAAGANIEARDRIGATPLMAAAKLASPEMVQMLLNSGANIKANDVIQNSALSWAAGFGQPGSVQVLIDAGADIEVSSGPVGFTPLIWAAGYGSPESVDILIKAGANLDAKDTAQGATALMHAARTSKIQSIKTLLEHKANLEVRTHVNNETVLLMAAKSSGASVDVVRMLVEAGADITATDDIGRNALALAKNRTDPRGPSVVAYLETIIKE